MTDKEEREQVLKTLTNMRDWMEAAQQINSTPERINALNYAISSIKTGLKYDLLYEGKQIADADKMIPNNSENPTGSIHCQHTDAEIAKSFIEDVTAVKDQLPCSNQMDFPDTFEEFAKDYGFKDKDEVYTNGSELIPVFRVKQWLEHISTTVIDIIQDMHGLARADVISDAVNRIITMPSVTPQEPRWIPVSERLPRNFEFVDCTCHSLIDDREDWVIETIYIPQSPNSPYSDWGNIPMLNHGDCKVIAWMYRDIPEPYKAESEVKECRLMK